MKSKKLLAGVLSAAMVLSTMALPAFADGETDVYTIGVGQTYGTFADALNAVDTNSDGIITYEIYGKVVLPDGGIRLGKDGITTINFTKGSDDAELSLEGTGLNLIGFDHVASLKEINYTGLKLSRLNGSYVGDAAHLNQFFTTTIRTNSEGIVTYTDCTFPNGSGSNTYGKTVYNNCTFSNADAGTKYNVWIRGGETEIKGGTVKGAAGIKLYSDDSTKVFGDTKIDGVQFENLTKKPAIVATQQGKIEITNSTVSNCEYGLIANESNQGAALANITVDGKAPAYVSSVNGNLYTETNYAEKEAQANGTQAKKVVAKVGDKFYTTLKDAFTAACNMNVVGVNGIPTQTTGVTIDLLADIENQEGFSAYGGEPQSGYGWHFVHNVDITLNGNGHRIDTGVHGSNNADTHKSPNINVSSNNGKFTVKNVIAPNDLLFTVTKPGHATSDCKDEARAESLVVEKCEFYGSNVGYDSTVNTVMYKNNKFLLTENENDHPDAYPLWYKFDWKITNFTFEDNTVKSQRALNLARFSQDSEIVINNNNFTIANSETPAKSAAIMLAENNTEQHPYNGHVTFNGNTVDAHSAVLVYAPSEYNTNFELTAENNTLRNGTKLLGYNSWSGSYNDPTQVADAEEKLENLLRQTAAKTVQLAFEKVSDSVYNIVVRGKGGRYINRLTAVDLTFAIDNSDIAYAISPADKVTLTEENGRYLFNFDGVNAADASGSGIVIGNVEFTGFGGFEFNATAGVANTTKFADNIVDTFVSDAATEEGLFDITNADAVINTTLVPATHKLTINITFPNNIVNQKTLYQDMAVAIKGGEVDETYKLGSDASNVVAWGEANNAYTLTISDKLVANTAYTVTVSGAGYRTARYTVTMNENKTLNFWNNVKDTPAVVEEGSTTGAKSVTFLAGDIVKDGKINIYDLSAVVSYFGESGLSVENHPEYAKYDLNRDGKIDSKDVAYVLVSWGK